MAMVRQDGIARGEEWFFVLDCHFWDYPVMISSRTDGRRARQREREIAGQIPRLIESTIAPSESRKRHQHEIHDFETYHKQ